ncbi:MAG TPA: hypothetical protein VJB06_01825 [archaeon]|nr:hypothetical protein [archaeon]
MSNKKGIAVGIEFVIIIVISVLILTLGTGFIRNLFKNINTIGIQVTEQAIQDLSEELKKDPNKKCVLTIGAEATAKRDVENTFKILLNNKGPGDACYKIGFRASGTRPLNEAVGWIDTVQTAWIKGGEIADLPVIMKIPPDADTGKFLFELKTGKNSLIQDSSTCERVNSTATTFPDDCRQTFVLNIE